MTAAEETEDESEPHSPSIRGRGSRRIALRGTKRKRRNKCWVVDLNRGKNDMRTEAAADSGGIEIEEREEEPGASVEASRCFRSLTN
ncbi:unnamed protein product [Linum trigynum]|uniref:Uncharacterized protein n=1 Tax=Linum trigynum TaxID=586398 RepID=A0AAV2FRY1_9ROSI